MNTITFIYILIFLFPICIYLSITRPFIFPFGLYAFLIPFDSILSVSGTAQGATLTKLLGILTIPVLLVKGSFENRIKKPEVASIWWIFFVIYSISSIAWSIMPDKAWSRIPTLVGLFLLYFVASFYRPFEDELEILKKFIIIGGLLASVISIYYFLSGSSYAGGLDERASLAVGDRTTNPNFLSFTLLLPIVFCTGMMLRQNQKLKVLYASILSVMILAVIMTGSRGNMIGIAVIFIVFILFAKRKISVGIMIVIASTIIIIFAQSYIVSRWSIALETGGAGRLTIWYIGWKALSKYWLFGSGLNNFPIAYTEFVNFASEYKHLYMDAHNTYLAMTVEVGIIGSFFLIIGLIQHYRIIQFTKFQKTNDRVVLSAAFFAILTSSFFSTFIWTKSFWLLWIIVILHKNVIKIDEEPEFQKISLNE